jgi:hypothetical protein
MGASIPVGLTSTPDDVRKFLENPEWFPRPPLEAEDVVALGSFVIGEGLFADQHPRNTPLDSAALREIVKLGLGAVLHCHVELCIESGFMPEPTSDDKTILNYAWRRSSHWQHDVAIRAMQAYERDPSSLSSRQLAVLRLYSWLTLESPLGFGPTTQLNSLIENLRKYDRHNTSSDEWRLSILHDIWRIAAEKSGDLRSLVFRGEDGKLRVSPRGVRDQLRLRKTRPLLSLDAPADDADDAESSIGSRVENSHVLEPETIEAIHIARETRDALDAGHPLRRLADDILQVRNQQVCIEGAVSLRNVRDLLGRVRDRSLQAALVYEFGRPAGSRQGAFDLQEVASYFEVSVDQVRRKGAQARKLLAAG